MSYIIIDVWDNVAFNLSVAASYSIKT